MVSKSRVTRIFASAVKRVNSRATKYTSKSGPTVVCPREDWRKRKVIVR